MSSLKKLTCKGNLGPVFFRVYRLEIQSRWYFRLSFVDYIAPLTFSQVHLPPPLFPVSKYGIYRQ